VYIFACYIDYHHAGGKEKYFENDVNATAERISDDGWTVYKTSSKEYKIPPSTLLRKVCSFPLQLRKGFL
jgi:hypothetical protein